MDSRARLLDAAARVYAEAGFRGATTRRIADEAGVNEVTLFRLFGSKEALILEALRSESSRPEAYALPDVPAQPEGELTAWCAAQIARLRERRALIRKSMGELAERPEIAPCVSRGPTTAYRDLLRYARQLPQAVVGDSGELSAAAAMLTGALFADAMGREVMPDMFPQPEGQAPRLYARAFLRALGLADPAPAGPSPHRRSARVSRRVR